jgi:hypothetical protein
MLRRIRAIAVSILLIAGVVYLATPPTAQLIHDHSNDKLGFLEHRGKRYWVKDLMNPAYRAASDNPFVRQFDRMEKWAGYYTPEDDKGYNPNPRFEATHIGSGRIQYLEPSTITADRP